LLDGERQLMELITGLEETVGEDIGVMMDFST